MQGSDIREHMEVVGSCGKHLGTVDHVEGNSIKLTQNDPESGGEHHFIPIDWVETVDDKVHLNREYGVAKRDWRSESIGSGQA